MAFLELEGIRKQFGPTVAVETINLAIEQGEFLTLLGPSGCGKTTILRMVAGFEQPSNGNILLDGDDITYLSANKRPMGMVFQSYALFPHMTAEQNIAFGMQIQRKSKSYVTQRCAELLALVGLDEMGPRYPHQLSGGQQQRIALARALAVEPKVLLLDEPLSALDAKVRVSLRNEIRRIQLQLKMTAIYVTHDQEEALSISDRIAVMAKGKIEQLGQPETIYSNPQTVFAATFVGTSNQFHAQMENVQEGICKTEDITLRVPAQPNLQNGARVLVVVRPEDISLQKANQEILTTINNRIAGKVELRTFLGPFTRFQVRVKDDMVLTADIPNQQAFNYEVGQDVEVLFTPQGCRVLPLEATEIDFVKQVQAEAV